MTSPSSLVAQDAAEIDRRLAGLPLTVLHLVILVVTGILFAIELLEFAMGQALTAVFSTGPSALSPGALSFLISSVYLGSVVGAPVMGWIADRRGIKLMLAVVVLGMSATSFLAAASPTPELLILARLLSGLALGAYPPLFIAYLSDVCPPRRRGMLIFYACALAYVGPPISIFAMRAMGHAPPLGIAAWRWPLWIGGLVCLILGLGFFALPEGPRWLSGRGRYTEANAACDRFMRSGVLLRFAATAVAEGVKAPTPHVLSPAATRWRFGFVGLLYLLSPFASIAFPLVTGPILLARGYNLSDTLFYVGLANFGPMAGALLVGLVIDRIRRSTALAIWGACELAVLGGFFFVPTPLAQMISVTGFGILSTVYITTLTTYGAELFPATVRARATAFAWSLNRIGAALGPIFLLPLARSHRFDSLEWILGIAIFASILLTSIRPPQPV